MMRIIATTLLLAGAASAKVILDFGAQWKWEASGTDLGSAWTGLNYNDAAWASGPAQLGFGDGDEATVLSGSTTQVYFRHVLTITPAEGYVGVSASVIRDDGVICYLNGVEIGRDNMPDGSAYGTLALTALSGDQESTPTTMNVGDGNLITGQNIIACSLHNQSPGSSDLSFDFSLEGTVAPSPSAPPLTTFDETVIGKTTGPWKFEDSGTSLTGTAWTTLGYDDATWGSANGVLGYGDGQPGALAQNGVTAYFRRIFTVDIAERVEFGKISVLRDDGIVCYVNGAEILRDNMPTGAITHDTLSSAGVGNADETAYSADVKFDRSVMQSGNNLLACEVHQSSATSSDLSFDAVVKLGLTINFNVPSSSPSASPPASPSRSPAASPAANPSPTSSPAPSPAGSGGGTDASASPAASPSPAAGNSAAPASPSPTRSPAVDGGVCSCSCTCLQSCAVGDPLIDSCNNNGGGSSGSGLGIALGVLGVVVVGAAAAGLFFYKKQQDSKKNQGGAKAAKDNTPNPLMIKDAGADVEEGAKPSRSRSRPDKERSSKDRDARDKERRSRRSEKDGEKSHRSSSRRHKEGEEGRSSSRRHKEGESEKDRSERKSRSDRKDKDGEKRHRSSSRRHKEGDKERSSSRKDKDGERRSSSRKDKDGERRSSSRKPDGERSRRSRSPRKSSKE